MKTAVFYANQNRSMNALCEFIKKSARFNLDGIDGKAAFFYAAKNDYADVIRELTSKGLDVNLTDDEGKTTVFYAIENRNVDALCELICWGNNLDEIDRIAALFYAAKRDLPRVITKLYSRASRHNLTNDEGKTAVFHANKNRSISALCELIRSLVEFDLDKIDGKAVLFHCAKNNVGNVIEILRDKGLDLNVTDDEGKTAVIYASQNGINTFYELIDCDVEFDLDKIDAKAVWFDAIINEWDYTDGIMRKLYLKGLDLNLTDDEGKTAVFYANQNGINDNCYVMKSLCQLIIWGAEFNLHEIDGEAALCYAAQANMKGVVKPLYDAGLDLNEGVTPVFYCNKDFLDAMIAVDEVPVNVRDKDGRTPLFYALKDSDTTKAQRLIEKGGNLQLKDRYNVSIYSFFINHCISKEIEALQLFTSELFQEEHHLKALTLAIFDTVYCQAPLLSVSGPPDFVKFYRVFDKTNILKALAFAHDADNAENVDKIASMIRENDIDVPLILSLLNKLGANPDAADSYGNTALHYASQLPFLGVTQEPVIEICKKLRKLGAFFDTKNYRGQSPLMFGLSSIILSSVPESTNILLSITGLVEVCKYLLSNGSSIEYIFHHIMDHLQQARYQVVALGKAVFEVMIKVLKSLSPERETVRYAATNFDARLDLPLRLWASIGLNVPQDYTSLVTGEHTFERFLRIILDHLLKCGAKLNLRDESDMTPLHHCRTWTAVKLLLDAEANPNVVDSSGQSPLLVEAKRTNSIKKTGSLYTDVIEDAETFWKSALERGLDPWIADKQGETLLSVFIKSEAFVLAKALVQVACKENYATNDVKLSLLNVISKDESKHTHWKTILVEVILNSARTGHLSLDSPLRFCCRNIVQFGMFDEKADSTQQKANDEPSDDDGQSRPKKRRKDESVKVQEEKEEPNEERVTYDSVHCKIAKQFLSHGADVHIHESSGMSCLDIAQYCPSLKDLLTKPIEIDTIPILIPWTSVSHKSKGILAKVARRQECEMIDQIWYCKDHIARGAFGVIFVGINQNDGREVALKRIQKSDMERPKDKREIKHLTALADCEQVVRYIYFFEDEQFFYIVLELMEGNLDDYLDGSKIDVNRATDLCKDVVMGLEFLHRQNILHRDMKPANILYKVHPKTCLKIADFGLSHIIDSVSTTVYRTGAGTRCWISPEVLTSKPDGVNKDHFARASDMFSCGLLLHYILSGQKHPFYPADYANKGKLQLPSETEMNIVNGKMEAWDNSLPPEATDLVKRMLESNEKDRPSAEKALEHPLFWSKKEKVEFLKAVGNQKEFECPRSKKILPLTGPSRKRTVPLTPIETDLENGIKFKANWNTSAYGNTHAIHRKMMTGTGRKDYASWSAVDLVRFIRNVYEHFKEKTFGTPVPIEKMLFKDFAFFDDFPDLVMEVYKAVTTHGWDKTRDDVKFAMNKK